MAEAVIAGIRDSGLKAEIAVGEPVAARRNHLAESYGVVASDSNRRVIEGAKLVILAVKPQQFKPVASGISSGMTVEGPDGLVDHGWNKDALDRTRAESSKPDPCHAEYPGPGQARHVGVGGDGGSPGRSDWLYFIDARRVGRSGPA